MGKTAGITAVLMLLSVLIPGCGGGDRYVEVKDVMQQYADAIKTYTSGIENADDPESIVSAIDAYNIRLRDLMPRIKRMGEKFPELKGKNGLPEELNGVSLEIREASEKLQAGMLKVMRFMDSKDVKTAIKEQGVILSALEKNK